MKKQNAMKTKIESVLNGTDRYRQYADAKAKIPMDLSPQEYEKRVKALAKKYKI